VDKRASTLAINTKTLDPSENLCRTEPYITAIFCTHNHSGRPKRVGSLTVYNYIYIYDKGKSPTSRQRDSLWPLAHES
jgi:hypothetical protein